MNTRGNRFQDKDYGTTLQVMILRVGRYWIVGYNDIPFCFFILKDFKINYYVFNKCFSKTQEYYIIPNKLN